MTYSVFFYVGKLEEAAAKQVQEEPQPGQEAVCSGRGGRNEEEIWPSQTAKCHLSRSWGTCSGQARLPFGNASHTL